MNPSGVYGALPGTSRPEHQGLLHKRLGIQLPPDQERAFWREEIRKVVTYWNAAPGEEEPDTQARVLGPDHQDRERPQRGACPDLCRVDRDSTRCTEPPRLTIPGGLLRDRRASVLSPLDMALGEQVLELHGQGPATLRRKRRQYEHRFSGNSPAGASLRANTNGMSSRGRDLSQFSHGLTGRYGTMASILDT
jgi:hypothetical protein